MRDWFPLTNYEFYAFVSSGMFLVATIDYCFAGGVLVHRTEWTLVQVIFWAVVSYVIGHICATPSSILLEHVVTQRLLGSPAAVQLGLHPARRREKVIAWLFAPREYAPLSSASQREILSALRPALGGRKRDSIDASRVIEIAHPAARQSEDAARRLDSFQNVYGFCRNICFVGAAATMCLVFRFGETKESWDAWLAVGAAATSFGMFGRFLKYYALYSREVLIRFLNTHRKPDINLDQK